MSIRAFLMLETGVSLFMSLFMMSLFMLMQRLQGIKKDLSVLSFQIRLIVMIVLLTIQ
jgi:hypothetical protein